MSRKKNLSPTASIAACLDFASRVLSSKATVQDMCTKSVLAPMVVEAHRFGQHVMKYLEPGLPADTRKLLRILQGKQNAKLCRDSPLIDLNVADLTWDFEGNVTDTLEMELEELKERATTNISEICVVFTASSSVSSGGQAVVWFPQNSYGRDEDAAPTNSKKQQFLLYVCPGRVKIVKSVADLVKKMFDELPFLRESDATYSVWAVVMDSNVSNQQEEASLKVESRVIKVDEGSQHSSSQTPSGSNETNQQGPEPPSAGPNNQNEVDENASEFPSKNVAHDDLPVASPRFSVYHRTSNDSQHSTPSISSLQTLDVGAKGTNEECEDEKEAERLDEEIVEAECSNSENNEGRVVRPNRAIVSTSLAQFSFSDGVEREYDFGLGVRLKENLSWQSCDGKVLRRSVRPQQITKLVEDELKAPRDSVLTEFSGDSDDAHAAFENAVHDKPNSDGEDNLCEGIQNESEVLRSDGLQEQCQRTELLVQKVKGVITSTVDAPPPLSIFTFERESAPLTVDTGRVSVDASSSTRRSLSVASSADASCNAESANGAEHEEFRQTETMDLSTENLQASVQDELPVVNGDEVEHLEQPDLAIECKTVSPKLKSKPVPVNYKDKLGAQVWWEIEYTARKLEREEILERKQQARHRHVDNRNGGIKLRKDRSLIGPLPRKDATGTSTLAGLENLKALAVASEKYVSGDYPSLLRGSIGTFESSKEQKLVDKLDAASSPGQVREISALHISDRVRQSSEMKESTYKSPSPFASKRQDSFSPRFEVDNSRKQEKNIRLSGGKVLSTHLSLRTTMAVEEETQDPKTIHTESPGKNQGDHQTTLSMKRVERSPRERKNSFKAATLDNVTSISSFMNPQESETMNQHDQAEAEDEDLAQMMWGSTRTSYEQDGNSSLPTSSGTQELETAEKVPLLPFTSHGRVPIRVRCASSTVDVSGTNDVKETSSNCSTVTSSTLDTRTPQDKLKPHNPVLSSTMHRTSTSHSRTKPSLASTFIGLGEDNSSHNTITNSETRQDRLNELRQRKLRKLQQTRDLSIQQQKQKQHLRQGQDLAFATSVYSKKASNRQLIQNALEFTLLAGGSMEKERTMALLALEQATCDNFIVLLKSAKELKFRALYENHVDRDCATRIFSVLPSSSARAPMQISSSDLISQFFKYSSAKKQFLPVPTRSFTVKTDACALADHLLPKNTQKGNSAALVRLL